MSPILEVRNLSKSFHGLQAVSDVNFEVAVGELLALIGPNGAGKSTCFNMLMGQLKPTTGEVYFQGENLVGQYPRDIWRKGIGRTFQITGTYSSMTVVENVQMALMSYRRRIFSMLPYAHKIYKEEAIEYLDMVGLASCLLYTSPSPRD